MNDVMTWLHVGNGARAGRIDTAIQGPREGNPYGAVVRAAGYGCRSLSGYDLPRAARSNHSEGRCRARD